MSQHVVVIGAGIVGALTALECLRDGHRVTIVEPGEPGGEQAASYGNGAWINSGTIMPVSTPGLWRKVPGFLADPLGPFAIRWRHLPRLAPWLLRFVKAGSSVAKVEQAARDRRALIIDNVALYRAIAAEAGVADHLAYDGLLYVFPSRAEFEKDALEWRLRRENGVSWREFDGEELRAFEPGLGPSYRFGAYVSEGCNLIDPGAFIAGLVAYLTRRGATLVKAKATGFGMADGRLRSVLTDAGAMSCDKAVICAGAWSGPLARAAGDAIPLESERGYHIVLSDPDYAPRHPIMPSDGKMALTTTRAGLRVAGQVELASLDAEPDWRRAEILVSFLHKAFPAIATRPDPTRIRRWMGHRPSTPDSLPSLGPASGCRDVLHGFGHGHAGMAMAPISARFLADLIGGKQPMLTAAPYAPQRFRQW